ncbi:MAG: hypothetical protein AABY15_02520, partial [Nanoarchaeota archaeon]
DGVANYNFSDIWSIQAVKNNEQMLVHKSEKVHNQRKAGTRIICQGTAYSINRRVLDRLYYDLREKVITATLLVEISRDMQKALYE